MDHHVSFGYDAGRRIRNDISLRFMRGKVAAVLGGPGGGKTTLLRLIGGMAAVDAGRVVFDGEVVNPRERQKVLRMRRRMGCCSSSGRCST